MVGSKAMRYGAVALVVVLGGGMALGDEWAEGARRVLHAADSPARNKDSDAAWAERQAKIAALRLDKKVVAAAWSADYCAAKNLRSESVQEIRTEQRYAREGGGVIDKDKVYALQARMRDADGRMSDAREILREAHLSLRPCSDRTVAELMACIDEDGNTTCDDLRLQVMYDPPKATAATE